MVKRAGRIVKEIPIWGDTIKDKYQGKTIGSAYTKDAAFYTDVDLDYNGGFETVIEYDDTGFTYDTSTKSILATQEQSLRPEKGIVTFEKRKQSGKIIKRQDGARIITSS